MINMNKYPLLYGNEFINPQMTKITDRSNKIQEDVEQERTTKERISIVNIDSRDRQINPTNVYAKIAHTLNNNPFKFKIGTNKISVVLENNNFKLNDRISINNVVGRHVTLKHRLILKKNSRYVKILDENHDMTYEYHNKNINVNISNVKGEITNYNPPNNLNLAKKLRKKQIRTGALLAGIPINLFNGKHTILFNILDEDCDDPMKDDPDLIILNNDIQTIQNLDFNDFETLEDSVTTNINPLKNKTINPQKIINKLVPPFYLIRLSKKADRDYIPDKKEGKDLENSNVVFDFLHLFGINLNLLNADYPLNINRRQGNHKISKIINKDKFEFCVGGTALEQRRNGNKFIGGGMCVELVKVTNVFDGYPDPNNYKIYPKKTFHNVKRIELISSIFPNTEKVFKNNPPNKINTKLYWNILNDGNTLYSIKITSGNYTPQKLEEEISNKVLGVERSSYLEQINRITTIFPNNLIKLDEIPKNGNPNDLCWSNEFNSIFNDIDKRTIMIPKINICTSQVQFSVYERMFLGKNIGSFDLTTLSFVVVHPFHPFNSSDEGQISIKINGSTNITENGITYSATAINTSHKLLKVIDVHRYRVEFDNSILLPEEQENNGGCNVVLMYPIKFRMLFNKMDTMGKQLGFNFVGEENSITPFAYQISNANLYEGETNVNCIDANSKKLVLSLSGDNYILITSKILTTFQNTGLVENVFAKIQLSDVPDTCLYNTFVHTPKIYEDPLTLLSEIEFKFYNYDGTLYDFNGADHSFCIRVTELINLPKNSHINARTGAKLQTFSDKGLLTY